MLSDAKTAFEQAHLEYSSKLDQRDQHTTQELEASYMQYTITLDQLCNIMAERGRDFVSEYDELSPFMLVLPHPYNDIPAETITAIEQAAADFLDLSFLNLGSSPLTSQPPSPAMTPSPVHNMGLAQPASSDNMDLTPPASPERDEFGNEYTPYRPPSRARTPWFTPSPTPLGTFAPIETAESTQSPKSSPPPVEAGSPKSATPEPEVSNSATPEPAPESSLSATDPIADIPVKTGHDDDNDDVSCDITGRQPHTSSKRNVFGTERVYTEDEDVSDQGEEADDTPRMVYTENEEAGNSPTPLPFNDEDSDDDIVCTGYKSPPPPEDPYTDSDGDIRIVVKSGIKEPDNPAAATASPASPASPHDSKRKKPARPPTPEDSEHSSSEFEEDDLPDVFSPKNNDGKKKKKPARPPTPEDSEHSSSEYDTASESNQPPKAKSKAKSKARSKPRARRGGKNIDPPYHPKGTQARPATEYC